MEKNYQDKGLSSAITLITILMLLYGLSTLEVSEAYFSMNKLLLDLRRNYLDFIIIGYIFICLQISGYVEIKHEQDYITASIVCLLLTPLALIFIVKNKNNNKDD